MQLYITSCLCLSVCRGEVGLFRTQFNEYMLAFVFLYKSMASAFLFALARWGYCLFLQEQSWHQQARCGAAALHIGPAQNQIAVRCSPILMHVNVSFIFFPKNPMCSVVLYYSHGNKKKYFKFYSISWRGMLTIRQTWIQHISINQSLFI